MALVYKTKWQNDFASKVFSMTDREIFDAIAFEYMCDDRFTERNKWEYNLLTQTFQIRMEWVNFTLKRDVEIVDKRSCWKATSSLI